MKVIINGGAWQGDSIARLRERFDPDGSILMHSFEPHTAFHSYFADIPNHVLHPEAIWIEDGRRQLFLQHPDPIHNSRGLGQGHSLLAEKSNVSKADSILVPCIDFAHWLEQNFSPADDIILKLDIEGAEYAVLRKMVTDGSIRLVGKLLVEFHHVKYPQLATQAEYESLLQSLPLEVDEW